MKNLGISNLLASRPSKERSIVTALIAYRVLHPAKQTGDHQSVARHDPPQRTRGGGRERG